MVDKEGCVSVCAYFNNDDSDCYNNILQNNIAAGCLYAGFVAPGHDCGEAESQQNFRDNVAHSVDGSGAHIFPDITGDNHALCFEGSHFASYKT
jgi:hypothetical protein